MSDLRGSASEIPEAIREILASSLTERGIGQWWHAPNRLLDGHTPAMCWTHEPNRRRVHRAADAFDRGFYV